MSIWGNRDREPSAEDQPADVGHDSDAPPEAVHNDEPSAGEAAPAFWRAQGRPLAPGYGRAPAFGQGAAEPETPAGEPTPANGQAASEEQEPAQDEAPLGGPDPAYGNTPAGGPAPAYRNTPAEVPAPAVSESPARTDTPAPVLAEDVVVIDAEAAVKDPALNEAAHDPAATEVTREPAAAEASASAEAPAPAEAPPAGAARSADAAAPGSPGGIAPQRWSEILVAFVDDPRGSVKMAADAVDLAIEEVVTSVRVRQRALASSWQGGDTDTEQLRTTLREYRKFGAQVQRMSPAEPAGQRRAGQGTAAAG